MSRDADLMAAALAAAGPARRVTPPNPWVGAAIAGGDGRTFVGATEAPGGRHAEIVALDAARQAGADVRGATLAVTLEPCSHWGRTGPCADALVDAGVGRVLVAVRDPDPRVAGQGLARLRAAGIVVVEGLCRREATAQLRPYLHHRRTGRPFVVLKLAATVDGRTAAADGTSRWITGPAARAEVHRLRAQSDAVLVGAGTVRADDPSLTVRDADGPDPQRVVLGAAAPTAKVHPCWEVSGPIPEVLAELGRRGVLQLLVEGGATVARAFHEAGAVDRYVVHLAPVLAGGDDGAPLFSGAGAPTMAAMWRGRFVGVRRLGDDVEMVIEPTGGRDGDAD